MRQLPITDLFIMLARSRTQQQRYAALANAWHSSRFDEDQKREIETLRNEAGNARENIHALRPLTNPVQDCAFLSRLQGGPSPILTPAIEAEIADWLGAWNRADELRLNGHFPPGGLLLTGPTGTGKTMTTRGIAGKMAGRPSVVLDAHNCVASHLGETGSNLGKAFDACERSGAMLVIEEIDAFAETRGGNSGGIGPENNRITIALMRMIEAAGFPIIATSNRLEALDPALVRRFEYRLDMQPLDDSARRVILAGLLGSEPGADLLALPLHQAVPRINRIRRTKFLAEVAAQPAA